MQHHSSTSACTRTCGLETESQRHWYVNFELPSLIWVPMTIWLSQDQWKTLFSTASRVFSTNLWPNRVQCIWEHSLDQRWRSQRSYWGECKQCYCVQSMIVDRGKFTCAEQTEVTKRAMHMNANVYLFGEITILSTPGSDTYLHYFILMMRISRWLYTKTCMHIHTHIHPRLYL